MTHFMDIYAKAPTNHLLSLLSLAPFIHFHNRILLNTQQYARVIPPAIPFVCFGVVMSTCRTSQTLSYVGAMLSTSGAQRSRGLALPRMRTSAPTAMRMRYCYNVKRKGIRR